MANFKHEISSYFLILEGNFDQPEPKFHNPGGDPDPLTELNPDPIRIWTPRHTNWSYSCLRSTPSRPLGACRILWGSALQVCSKSCLIFSVLWNRNYLLRFRFPSGSDFWKVMVPVPVPTFEKLWFRFRFLLLKKLRFRFRSQLHI